MPCDPRLSSAGSTQAFMLKPLYYQIFLSSSNHAAFNAFRLSVLLYAASLQASPAMLGLLAASNGLISVFTAVALGRWIDRVGPRKPFMIASLVMAASCVLAWFVEGLVLVFVISPLIGVINSIFQIGSHQAIGRFGKPEERTANFTLHSLGISAATFVGPMVSGLSVDHLGALNSFLVIAVLSACPLLVLGSKLLEYPPQAKRIREPSAEVKGAWSLLRNANLRRAWVVSSMNSCLWSLVGFLIPVYGTQIGMSATRIGTLMAIMAIGTVAIRLAMPWLMRTTGRWQLVAGAQMLTAIGFIGMPFTEVYLWMGVFACSIGAGLGLSGPVSSTLMYDASPPERVGEVVGMRVTVGNIGQTVLPLLSGAVGAALGVAPVFWVVSAIVLGNVYSHRDLLATSKKPGA